MATLIPCTVDTEPMAQEIDSVSNHIEGTTAAVVTMQSAVIAASNANTKKVCKNVNRGFFSLVRSQISQKIANKQSRVEALLMKLAQQKRMLLGIKANMEREYGRIAARYIKIFTVLNKDLEQRIRKVDQPVFELVNKHMLTSSNRMNSLTAWVSTSQNEGITQSQQIIVSKMKKNAQTALQQSQDFLTNLGEQKVLMGKLLISGNAKVEKNLKTPVLISETIDDSSGIPRVEISVPKDLSGASASQINTTIRSTDDLPWKKETISSITADEFNNLLESSDVSFRVKDLIKKMYSSSDFETI